jgi:hypothetical protein
VGRLLPAVKTAGYKMLDVMAGRLLPAVKTAGYKMLDVMIGAAFTRR